MRKRYVWDKASQKMVLKAEGETRKQMHYVQSFIPFSPTSDPNVVLASTRDIKDYEKRTGLDHLADYKPEDFLPPSVEEVQAKNRGEIMTLTDEVVRAYEQNTGDYENAHYKIMEAVERGEL